jgi:glycosyltransferase involved in cell wall biosynthesis
MRLAFLGDGSLNHVRRWVGYFQGRGHEVLLLSFESVEGCPFPARRFPKRLPTNLLGYLSSLASIRRELDAFRPDLLSALYVGGYGLVASLSGWRPLAVTSLGSDLLVDYPSSFIHRVQIRHVLRRADLVITDAEELSRVAVEIGTPREKVLKAYFGIDETIFHPGARAAAPGGAEPARIVSTRNLYGVYNLDLLVEAAPAIAERHTAAFILCGDGPERQRLEERVRALGLSSRFSFRGRLEPRGIAEELRAASVYVSTSRSDSTSVSLLEAMACGAPPVVTDLIANREWITDGENGLIVPRDDPAALAGAVLRMIEDSGFAAAAREQNFRIVKERGLWHDNMERVADAFEKLVSRARR